MRDKSAPPHHSKPGAGEKKTEATTSEEPSDSDGGNALSSAEDEPFTVSDEDILDDSTISCVKNRQNITCQWNKSKCLKASARRVRAESSNGTSISSDASSHSTTSSHSRNHKATIQTYERPKTNKTNSSSCAQSDASSEGKAPTGGSGEEQRLCVGSNSSSSGDVANNSSKPQEADFKGSANDESNTESQSTGSGSH